MSKIYFTLTGTRYYHGNEFLKPGMKLNLKKEPDNKFDKEAIVVKTEGLGEIGHVANSAHTVIGESMSAGRIHDKIGDTAKTKVVLVTPHETICSLSKKMSLIFSGQGRGDRVQKEDFFFKDGVVAQMKDSES